MFLFPLSSRRFAPLAPEAPVVEPRWGSIIRMIGNPACATRRWALESNAVGVKVRWARHASPLRIGGLENPPSVISCASCSSMFIFRSGFTSLFTLHSFLWREAPPSLCPLCALWLIPPNSPPFSLLPRRHYPVHRWIHSRPACPIRGHNPCGRLRNRSNHHFPTCRTRLRIRAFFFAL